MRGIAATRRRIANGRSLPATVNRKLPCRQTGACPRAIWDAAIDKGGLETYGRPNATSIAQSSNYLLTKHFREKGRLPLPHKHLHARRIR